MASVGLNECPTCGNQDKTGSVYDQWGSVYRLGSFEFFGLTGVISASSCLLLLFFGCTLINTYRTYTGPSSLPIVIVRAILSTLGQSLRLRPSIYGILRAIFTGFLFRLLYITHVSLKNGLHYDPVLNQVDDRSIRQWFSRLQPQRYVTTFIDYLDYFTRESFNFTSFRLTRYWCRNSTYWQEYSRMTPRPYACSIQMIGHVHSYPCSFPSTFSPFSSRPGALVSAELFELRQFYNGDLGYLVEREEPVYSLALARYDPLRGSRYDVSQTSIQGYTEGDWIDIQQFITTYISQTGKFASISQTGKLASINQTGKLVPFNTLLSQFEALNLSSSKLMTVRDEQTLNRVINSINLPRAPTVPSSLYDGYSITRRLSQIRSINGSKDSGRFDTVLKLDLSVIKRSQVMNLASRKEIGELSPELSHVQEIQDVIINVTSMTYRSTSMIYRSNDYEEKLTYIVSSTSTAYVRDVIKILNASSTNPCTYLIKDKWIVELIQEISRLLDHTTTSPFHRRLMILEFIAHYDRSYDLLLPTEPITSYH